MITAVVSDEKAADELTTYVIVKKMSLKRFHNCQYMLNIV